VSRGGRTLQVTLKRGVFFSPPVNREVRADDVKYAIERAFTPSVSNGYVATYFGELRGLREFKAGKTPGISGTQAPGRDRLVFRFSRPVAAIAARAV
jgi:peptide/nickel transport system substrate-binding protein